MDTDKRITAVRTLEALGYTWRGGAWRPPTTTTSLEGEADAMPTAPVHRGDALARLGGPRLKGSREEAELRAILDLMETDEAKQWPEGREPGGRG